MIKYATVYTYVKKIKKNYKVKINIKILFNST